MILAEAGLGISEAGEHGLVCPRVHGRKPFTAEEIEAHPGLGQDSSPRES